MSGGCSDMCRRDGEALKNTIRGGKGGGKKGRELNFSREPSIKLSKPSERER